MKRLPVIIRSLVIPVLSLVVCVWVMMSSVYFFLTNQSLGFFDTRNKVQSFLMHASLAAYAIGYYFFGITFFVVLGTAVLFLYDALRQKRKKSGVYSTILAIGFCGGLLLVPYDRLYAGVISSHVYMIMQTLIDPFIITLWLYACITLCLTYIMYRHGAFFYTWVALGVSMVQRAMAYGAQAALLVYQKSVCIFTPLYQKIRAGLFKEKSDVYALEEDDMFWETFFEEKRDDSVRELVKEQELVVPKQPIVLQEEVQQKETDASYILPSIDIFTAVEHVADDKQFMKGLQDQAKVLTDKLQKFGIVGHVTAIEYGPVVTLFEYQPQADSKLSKIIALEDDLAMALEAHSIRILAPIPGKSVVGFEVANKHPRAVSFAAIIKHEEYKQQKRTLPLILGEDTIGKKVVVDLAKMPHLLVAGSTGSGKSVALNTMLMSLLCRHNPDELKLILIDPKRLEFAGYQDIAHLLFPIVTAPKQAIDVLKWLVRTMEDRYEQMAALQVKNIFDYHAQGEHAKKDMPFIVLMIDELADLMMTAGKEVEHCIARIAQMARAAGIHMIVATQRPSVDVITGLIKVNFPSRISFRVTSKVDSRTILDCMGAEKLLGRGDMLFLDAGSAHVMRVHGAYISTQEIIQVVDHIKKQRPPSYIDLTIPILHDQEGESDDTMYDSIVQYVRSVDEVSISLLQRKFKIGYNRSARLIERLEQQGYILPADGAKMRKVNKQL